MVLIIIIRCPEIRPYIKHLDVYCGARGTWAPTCTCFMRKGYTQLGAILTRSPMLHALRLQDRIGSKLSLMMHSVEIVELHNVYMTSVQDLHSWLSAFPRLLSFSFEVFLCMPLLKPQPWRTAMSRLAESFNPRAWLNLKASKRAATPLDLSHFRVSPTLSSTCLIWFVDPACATEAISKQLIAHKASNNLRRLSLHVEWWRDAMPSSSLFVFVRSLGPSLTHLEIGIMLSRWATDLMAEQGERVSPLRSLAGLTVRSRDVCPAPQGNGEPSRSPTV